MNDTISQKLHGGRQQRIGIRTSFQFDEREPFSFAMHQIEGIGSYVRNAATGT